MPKISYLDILDNGADYTEVTASHIEQKIADIEALLRGMIDEDNLLAKDDGSGIVPISPSNVADMPVETRPVQQCMKFFGITTSHDTGIVENLFDEIIGIADKSPFFSLLNGLGDKEIVMISENADTASVQTKIVTIEIPFNYTVLTWKDLWEYVSSANKNIGIGINNGSTSLHDKFVLREINTLSDFLSEFDVKEKDYAIETFYNIPRNNSLEYFVDINEKNNTALAQASISPDADEWVYRVVSSMLCRVNP